MIRNLLMMQFHASPKQWRIRSPDRILSQPLARGPRSCSMMALELGVAESVVQ